jgi:hypothetical protein
MLIVSETTVARKFRLLRLIDFAASIPSKPNSKLINLFVLMRFVVILTSPELRIALIAGIFDALRAGSHADNKTVASAMTADIITACHAKINSKFITILLKLFIPASRLLAIDVPTNSTNVPIIIPAGMPIIESHSPSYITIAAIWRFVAPTLFSMPNCRVRSPALTLNAFEMTTTDTKTTIRQSMPTIPSIVTENTALLYLSSPTVTLIIAAALAVNPQIAVIIAVDSAIPEIVQIARLKFTFI